jgi:hypothetical protein
MLLDSYFELNDALNDYFLDGKFEHRPVYLDLEGEAAAVVGQAVGVNEEELGHYIGKTVATTLRLEEADPYIQQLEWLRKWNEAGRTDAPPFTALLCAFSIAAERMSTDENFSSNNYYVRLFDLFRVSGCTAEQKFRQHAKSTRQFWRALNIWLSERDYELGRPTARPVNAWPYASYGLSQALVRDADRERFGKLFEAMRLVPGDNISESEMMLYVHEWMSSSNGPTTWLRKLWNVADLRERVVAAALEELETWERKEGDNTAGPDRTKLSWTLGFTGFPSRRASLALSARNTHGGEALEIESVSDEIVRAALVDAGESLSLSESAEDGFLILGPVSEIDICRLLLGSTVLAGKESGTRFAFTAKPVVVMARSEDGTSFREVQRAGLFEELAVLCHETWLTRVESHLRACGKPGHTIIRHGEMRGIPEGWAIVRDVELVRALDQVPNGMQQLNPMSGQASISAEGGLRLSPGLWHASAPPRLEATSVRKGSKLEVQKEVMGAAEKKLLSVDASGDYMEAALDGLAISSGTNLRAVVKQGSKELAELGLSFRSADVPRPLGKHALLNEPVDGRLQWTGASSGETLPAIYLQGAVYEGLADLQDAPRQVASSSPAALPEGSAEIDALPDWKALPGAEKEAPGTCVVKGYHHLKYDAFEDGDDRYDAKRAVCLVCGWETMSRTREEALKNARAMRENAVVPARRLRRRSADPAATETDTPTEGVDIEVFLDGLCYLGRGSWAHFQRLCAPLSEETWFAQSLAGDLEALGHIEIERDTAGRPRQWQVTPPALVVREGAAAYLAGFQSRAMIKALQDALAPFAQYKPSRQHGGILLHLWEDIDIAKLGKLAGKIRDPHGRELRVPPKPAEAIAMNIESLPASVSRMPPIHVDRSDGLARYDVDRGNWLRAEELDRPGAYKVSVHGTRYVYRALDGSTRTTTHAAAKILAARDQGKRLHAYDPAKKTFSSVLGVEPPGLYARALAMSAGKLSRIEGGRQHFEGVSKEVGDLVMTKLYEQG